MKRLWVVGFLCLAGFVAAPITSASAVNREKGIFGTVAEPATCFIEGEATFKPGLTFKPVKATYSFADGKVEALNENFFGKKESVECEGTAKEGAVVQEGEWIGVSANVEKGNEKIPGPAADNGELECGTKSKDSTKDEEFEGATATIKLKNKATGDVWTFKSHFRFKSTTRPGEITAELRKKGPGAPEAKGQANFIGPKNAAAVKNRGECTTGAEKLSFETAEEGKALKPALLAFCALMPPPAKAACIVAAKALPAVPAVGIEGVIGE